MRRDVGLYLKDILQNIADINQYIEGMSFEQFEKDSKTVKAVIRSIEVIGEAVKNIPQSIRSNRPDVPWREMARMRDKCIHFYFGVDNEIVWLTAKDRLPELHFPIKEILDNLS